MDGGPKTMVRVLGVLRAVLAVMVMVPAMARAIDQTEATVDTGQLRGVAADGVVAFKGIPYAAPPVGTLRWRAPQAALPWKGIRPAKDYGSDCMQAPFPSDAAPLGTPPAEDCLYLNVWRPAQEKPGEQLPVMIWIYGGGFVNGGASPAVYSGADLARHGVVVVSFNYRVGRFGFFAHPQLTRANADDGLIGNYGFMDQLAALRWVKRNIAVFGGNPEQVTVVGESAGGMSVHTLVTSPMAVGLFQRAVVESGGDGDTMMGTLAEAERAGLAFARGRGIAADDPKALDKLRSLSASAVTDGLNLSALFSPGTETQTYSGPIVDGKLAVDGQKAYRNGQFMPVPMMIGATSADLGGPDGGMIRGARLIADLVSAQHLPVYEYRFGYVADSMRERWTGGAPHASDIPYFFGTVQAKYGDDLTARDRRASAFAEGYLLNFVKTGNPNGGDLPQWPLHTAQRPFMQDMTLDGQVVTQMDRPPDDAVRAGH